MTVCSFFLQGRCRYGEKCWNEHPRGGGSSYGGYSNNSRSLPQSSSYRGGGGFGNKVWVNPSQRSSGRDYVAPPSFQKGGSDWGRGGDRELKNFSFSSQNRFSALDSHQGFDRSAQDDHEKQLETIHKDMDLWETSGQWLFSCYSVLKIPVSGLSDLSPEELRLEYYKCREAGSLHTYASQVQHLFSQYKSRIQELKTVNSTSLASLVSELNNSNSQTSPVGFGSSASAFGRAGFGAATSDSSSFSFKAPSSGFGSADTHTAPVGFGSLKPPQAPSLFSSSGPSAAASFSFTAPAGPRTQATGFGDLSGPSGFSFSSSSFGSPLASTSAAGGSSFGGSASAFGGAPAGAAVGTASRLFTPQSELTPDELTEFMSSRFTLGQVPLKPPPVDILIV